MCVCWDLRRDGDVSGRGASGGRGARRSVVGSAPARVMARVRGGGVSRRSVVGGGGAAGVRAAWVRDAVRGHRDRARARVMVTVELGLG